MATETIEKSSTNIDEFETNNKEFQRVLIQITERKTRKMPKIFVLSLLWQKQCTIEIIVRF